MIAAVVVLAAYAVPILAPGHPLPFGVAPRHPSETGSTADNVNELQGRTTRYTKF